MAKRIVLLHTVVFLADMFRRLFQEYLPNTNTCHMVDEGIIQELMRAQKLTPKIRRRLAMQVTMANDIGADLILFTCSSTSPLVDTLEKMSDIPILKIDEPMAEKAVDLGKKIGVITTAKTTLGPSVDLIESHAIKVGKTIEIQAKLETQAFAAKLSGNSNEHDRIVTTAASKLAEKNDVIVLAQASMAHLAAELNLQINCPVLASPEICIEKLKSMGYQ